MTFLIETNRLIIKPTSMEYLANIHELNSDREVMKYINFNFSSKEVTKESLEKAIAPF